MKRLSEFVLLAAGVALMVVGVSLMFDHQHAEMAFQHELLTKLGPDYHWRTIGDANFGVDAICLGAVLVTISAILEAMMRRIEWISSRYPRG